MMDIEEEDDEEQDLLVGIPTNSGGRRMKT